MSLVDISQIVNELTSLFLKDALWVLRSNERLVHVSVDISLITKHILDPDISLKS